MREVKVFTLAKNTISVDELEDGTWVWFVWRSMFVIPLRFTNPVGAVKAAIARGKNRF